MLNSLLSVEVFVISMQALEAINVTFIGSEFTFAEVHINNCLVHYICLEIILYMADI